MARRNRIFLAMDRARPVAVAAFLAGAAAWPAAAQPDQSRMLPSLVLPPAAATEPQGFEAMMRAGDTAMVRGDILRARTLYEQAATIHPRSAAAAIAAGKTYDPNLLPAFGAGPGLADRDRARSWYGRARAIGDPAAAALQEALRQGP